VTAGCVLAAALLAALLAPPDKVRWGSEERLTTDPGASLLTYNFARSAAVDDSGRLHAVWYDSRGGAPHVFYRRFDGSAWEPERRLSEGVDGQHPSVAVAGSSVFVVWHGAHGNGLEIHCRRSLDGGATWQPVTILTGSGAAAHASIAAAGRSVHVVWGDVRSGSAEIYWRPSADGGASWEEERRLSDPPFESWVPSVAAAGEEVRVAWVDLRDGNEEEYVKISRDGGRHWGPDTRLTVDGADSWAPSIVLSSGVAHLAWFDRRDAGVRHDEVEAQLDAILALMGLPSGPPPPSDPHTYYLPPFRARVEEKSRRIQDAVAAWVASGGDPVRLERELREFERRMRDWETGWEIYYTRSTDGGLSWLPEVRMTEASGVSARPSLAVDGENVLLVWFDSRDGDFEIYFKQSRDGGETWLPDLRLTEAAGDSAHPTVAARGGAVHVLWHDTRDGNAEIYHRRGLTAKRLR
jgi:hypothetical protein